jgi:dihydrofolate synthase / folylpolyglutamate synthase
MSMRPTSVPRAAAYLEERTRFGIKFGLDTMRALTGALGHPERAYACLIVAGTNGKGSVTAYVDRALRAAGLKVGRYTSPHLVRVNERIAVGGREIGERSLDRVVAQVRSTAEVLVREGRIPAHPTYFEALTAAAFVHFRVALVDVAVLEVGMGGRLDATNVCEPLASAIVSLDYDHEAYLGRTLGAIAREKAGVMRQGRTTVLGPLAEEATNAVRAEAEARGARLVFARADVRVTKGKPGFAIRTPGARYAGLRPLPGDHQLDNLVVSLRLVEAAREAGLPVALIRAAAGLRRVFWPGRLERIPGKPPLLLDGAHNPAGARALASFLRPRGPFVLLFGVMGDKDIGEMAQHLFPLARAIVLTRPPIDRAATPAEVMSRARGLAAEAECEADPEKGLAHARRLARPGETVVVAGSLYLVGAIRELIKARK